MISSGGGCWVWTERMAASTNSAPLKQAIATEMVGALLVAKAWPGEEASGSVGTPSWYLVYWDGHGRHRTPADGALAQTSRMASTSWSTRQFCGAPLPPDSQA